jgi:hypothetical protein
MAEVPPHANSAAPHSPNGEVISPDGVEELNEEQSPVGEIESPTKIIRIGAMVKQLLDEVRNTAMDEAARDHLRDIYDNSVAELRTALSPDLAAELDRLALDLGDDTTPSESELRVAQAQLVGWLEGLFHGIQATLMTQQMAARQQLEGMRAQLQRPSGPPTGGPGYI